MNIRNHILLFILKGFIFINPATAQSNLNFEATQVFSTFKFSSNILDQDKTYSHSISGAYNIGYLYNDTSGVFVRGGLGMRKAGATSVYNNLNYTWEMQYCDAKVGIGYQTSKWRLNPYGALSFYYAYLLSGNQNMGQYNYDIVATKSMMPTDFGLFIGLGLKTALSDYISIYSEYNYILGLHNIETTAGQNLYNRGFSINFGMSVNISKHIKKSIPLPINGKDGKDGLIGATGFVGSTGVTGVTGATGDAGDAGDMGATGATGANGNIGATNLSGTSNTTPISQTNTNTSPSNFSPSSNHSKSANLLPAQTPVNYNIVFKVQVTAVKEPLRKNSRLLKNIKEKVEIVNGKDGWIRYYIGSYKKYEEARAHLNDVKSKCGVQGGFIVAFKDGKQITVSEAKSLSK